MCYILNIEHPFQSLRKDLALLDIKNIVTEQFGLRPICFFFVVTLNGNNNSQLVATAIQQVCIGS
jgi:hypothetical protein